MEKEHGKGLRYKLFCCGGVGAELVDVKNHKKQKEVDQKFITVKEAWHDFVVSILTGFVA